MERPDIDRVREQLERLEQSDEVERRTDAESEDGDEDRGDEEEPERE